MGNSIGNFLSNYISKPFVSYVASPVAKTIFHYEPESDPKLEDINSELAEINGKKNEAFENIKKLFSEDKDIANVLWKHIMVTGNFKNTLDEDDVEKFSGYINDVVNIGADFYVDKLKSDYTLKSLTNHSYYTSSSNENKKKILYNNSVEIFTEIEELINEQIGKREGVAKELKILLDSKSLGNEGDADKKQINLKSTDFNYGVLFKLLTYMNDLSKEIIDLEAGYMIEKDFNDHNIYSYWDKNKKIGTKKRTSSKYNYNNLWNKWRKWKGRDKHTEISANQEILAPYLKSIADSDFNSKKISIGVYEKQIDDFFKDLTAIKYRLDTLDHPIIGSMPENKVIQNNDTFIIKKRLGFDTKKVIKIGNFGLSDYQEFANRLSEGLQKECPNTYRIEVIYPPPAADQYIDDDKEIRNKFHWKKINNIFQKLKAQGFDSSYDYKIYYIISSDEPFSILGNDKAFTMQKWLSLNAVEKRSKFNDKNDTENGADDETFIFGKKIKNPKYDPETKKEPQFISDPKNKKEYKVIAPGPYYALLGGFSKNSSDLIELKNKEKKKILDKLDGWITERFTKIGWKPAFAEIKDEDNKKESDSKDSNDSKDVNKDGKVDSK